MNWITRLDRHGRVPRISLDLFAGRPADDGEQPGEGEVLIALPEQPLPPGMALVVSDGETDVVEDHIGEIHYSAATGARVEIDALGPLPAGLVAAPPPPASSQASVTHVDGQWRVTEPLPPLREAALAEVIGLANQITRRVTRQYPAAEVTSWPTQEAEARAVLAGGNASAAPLLAALAAGASVTVQAYAQTVIAKANAYRAILVAVKGLRDAAQTGLDEADTPEEIAAVLDAARVEAEAAMTRFGLRS